MNIFRHLLLCHPLALVSFLVSTIMVGTPFQVKAAQIIPQDQLSVASSNSQQNSKYAASSSIDGNNTTMWHTQWSPTRVPFPHQITLRLAASHIVSGLRYLPRQDGQSYGIITQYAIYVSTDGTSWGRAVAQGTWPGTSALKEVTFPNTLGSYVRLVSTASANGLSHGSAAEINIVGTPVSSVPSSKPIARKLSWIDNAGDEDGYKIERKIGTSGTYVRLSVVPTNTTSHTDTDTQSGATYCYRVQAFNTKGSSPFSNEACSTGQSGTSAPLVPGAGGTTGPIATPDTPQDPSDSGGQNAGGHTAHSLAIHIGVYRPSTASWYLDYNANGQFDGCEADICSSAFGLIGDLPVVGDWNGTGTSQIGVFNSRSRLWDLDANRNVRWDACEDDLCRGPFGKKDDLPVSGRWVGHGSPSRIGIFRPRTGMWILDTNGNGRVDRREARDTRLGPFGTATDLPVVGDWTGTGKTQIGTFTPSTGQWQLDQNGNGVFDGCSIDRCAGPFGNSDSYPIAADWIGSGASQIGIFDATTRIWQLDTNGNDVFDGCSIDHCVGPFGQAGDIPVVGQW